MSFMLDIVADVVSSAFWESIRDPLLGRSQRQSGQQHSAAWSNVVETALENLEPRLQKLDTIEGDEIAAFLQSTEVRRLVTQIYFARLDEGGVSLANARQAFAAIWGVRYGRVDGFEPYELFDILSDACERILDRAIGSAPAVAAHEAKSASRHQALTQRLHAVEQQLHHLVGDARSEPVALAEVDDVMQQLAAGANKRHGTIFPPSLHGARRVALDRLYVAPHFHLEGHAKPFDYAALRSGFQRVVVLGSPGAGKTTLLKKLSVDASVTLPNGSSSPVIVISLREYAQELQHGPVAIRDFVSAIASSHYQISVEADILEYALLAGRLCIAFDGLDELQVIGQRRDIIGNIEAFVGQYPQTPIVVTSRVVGYEHAALDSDLFIAVRLTDFTSKQVAEYAQRWFSLDERPDLPAAAQRTSDFVEESESVPDLRANPLLLGLMCNLYKGRGFIPRNRPEVYEKCATMLFETWDAQRNIDVLKPFEDLLRPTIRHLAYWIYADPLLSVGVTEHAATVETQRFLATWRFGDDQAKAEHAARSFIDFCRGRAWVFSDLGADQDDSAVFQFTHQTFLEFFAAEQMVQDHESTADLLTAIRPHIDMDEWEVVTQLAVQMQQRRHLGAADTMLLALADPEHISEGGIAFSARALHNVVPKPATVTTITLAVLQLIGRDLVAADVLPNHQYTAVRARLKELLSCDGENRETVAATMRSVIVAWIADETSRTAALEISMLGDSLLRTVGKGDATEPQRWWHAQFDLLREAVRDAVVAAASAGDSDATYYCVRNGWLSPEEAVQAQGCDFVTHTPVVKAMPVSLLSLGEEAFCHPDPAATHELVGYLLAQPTPWFGLDAIADLTVEFSALIRACEESRLALLLVAALIEPANDVTFTKRPSASSSQALLTLEQAAENFEDEYAEAPLAVRLLLSRGDHDSAPEIVEELRASSHEDAFSEMLDGWMRRHVSFVRV
jgi:hypothetical protein